MNVTKINTVPTFRLACNITIMTIIIPLTTKASNKPKSFIQFYPCHTMVEIKSVFSVPQRTCCRDNWDINSYSNFSSGRDLSVTESNIDQVKSVRNVALLQN